MKRREFITLLGGTATCRLRRENVAIEYRSGDFHSDRFPLLLEDLLRRQVALIVGLDTPAVLAAKAATTTVPIVFVSGVDPVQLGLVASLNRPGGNVTGISFITGELGTKRLGLLRELRPGATRIAVLVDPKWPLTERFVSEVRAGILKGEKPGDLPVVLSTKFELAINLKTAKALSLEIPDKLLALADEVIE